MRRADWVALALAALAFTAGCKRQSEQTSTQVTVPAEVPAPEGLIADLYVARPAEAWRRFRDLGAPVSELLPAGYALLLTSTLGFPPLTASSFDQELPLVGAVVALPGERVGAVIALHVVDGRELIAKLTTGSTAEFRTENEPKSGATFVVRVKEPKGPVLAVFDNYLLVADSRDTVPIAGPYAARTLPKRRASAEPIALTLRKEALRGPLANAVRGAWRARKAELQARAREEETKRGRVADFADPAAVLTGVDMAIESLLSVLESADGAELRVEPLAERLQVRLRILPAAFGRAAELRQNMQIGDLAAFLSLPANVSVALLQRKRVDAREEAAKNAGEEWAQLLGERLKASDRTRVSNAFANWERGRGELSVYALLGGAEPSVLYRSDVSDPSAFEKGARGILGLATIPSVAAPLTQFVGKPSVRESNLRIPELPKLASRVELAFSAKDAPPNRFEFLWFVDGTLALGAAGKAPKAALIELQAAGANKAPSLAGESEVQKLCTNLAPTVSVALYADAGGLFGATQKAQPSPVLLSFGKDGSSIALNLDASRDALSNAIRASVRQ